MDGWWLPEELPEEGELLRVTDVEVRGRGEIYIYLMHSTANLILKVRVQGWWPA